MLRGDAEHLDGAGLRQRGPHGDERVDRDAIGSPGVPKSTSPLDPNPGTRNGESSAVNARLRRRPLAK